MFPKCREIKHNHRSDGFLSGRGRLPNACAFVGVSLRRHALCKVRRSSAASKCRACRKTTASKMVMRRISGQAESPHESGVRRPSPRSEEHTSELQSLMRISYAVFCLKKKTTIYRI